MTEAEFKKKCDEWGYVIKNGVLAFQKGCLSNWYGAYKGQEDGQFTYNEHFYNCSEQYMMHMKATIFEGYLKDPNSSSRLIMVATSPKVQKDLGRTVKNFDPVLWEKIRGPVVFLGLLEKFRWNQSLKEFLLATGDLILVEASPWDKIWGVGTNQFDETTFNPAKWQGQNLLGKTLMDVRTCLKNHQTIQSA